MFPKLYQVTIFLLFLASGVAHSAETLIEPSEIGWLSKDFKTSLIRKNCRIPAIAPEFNAFGIVVGNFAHEDQLDIAVLCVTEKTRTIIVSWGGQYSCANEISNAAEAIASVDSDYIWTHHERYGGNKPPEMKHHGVNDIYIEKASTVHYCFEGKWLELSGAD